jgi:hypothetical protein
MAAKRMTSFSAAYEDVARLFHAAAAGVGGRDVVPHPVAQDQIAAAERELGAALPESFRLFQLEFGDCQHAPIDIYSALPAEAPGLNLVTISRLKPLRSHSWYGFAANWKSVSPKNRNSGRSGKPAPPMPSRETC